MFPGLNSRKNIGINNNISTVGVISNINSTIGNNN